MPDVDPVMYDAIDEVIENRDPQAEWDPDEMRSALLEVLKGGSQSEAAEQRDFSQAVLSKRVSDVEEYAERISQSRSEGSGLFTDPLEQAISDLKGVFDRLNDRYDMGVKDKAIQMLVDEIRDTGQLPRPMYVRNFLERANSGVSNTGDLDYIERAYRRWYENAKTQYGDGNQRQPQPGMGGQQIGRGGPPQGGRGMQVQQQQGAPSMFPDQPQQQEDPRDPRVDELQGEIEEIKEFLAESAEQEQQQGMVEIEMGEGQTARVPMNHPMAMQMMMQDDSDDEDMFDVIQKAADAGIIVTPNDLQDMQDGGDSFEEMFSKAKEFGLIDDDEGEEMADAIGRAIESLGEKQMQAQKQMSENMKTVLDQINQAQESEEDDLSREDVAEIIDDKLTEDETDRLQREIKQMRNDFAERLEDARRTDTEGVKDPEVLKTNRTMDFREKQMETISENLRELPKEISVALGNELIPALKEMGQPAGVSAGPLWTPPGVQGGQAGGGAQQQQQARQRQADQGRTQQRQQTESRGTREVRPDSQPGASGQTQDSSMGQAQPDEGDEEYASEVRERLDLGDDGDTQEAEA